MTALPRLEVSATERVQTETYPRRVGERLAGRTVIVASDGADIGAGVVRIADALVERLHVNPIVVSAVEPMVTPLALEAPVTFAPTAAMEEGRRLARGHEIEAHVRQAGGSLAWPRVIETGDPTTVIVERARDAMAGLIVMGLHRYTTMDRIFRDETTLRVMRRAGVPVLGVTRALTAMPRHIVAAVDFSRASLRAARLALALLGDGGVLHLVCVQAEAEPLTEDREGRRVIFEQGVHGAFVRLVRELAAPPGVTVEPVLLEGKPAPELLAFAARTHADVIAIGSHRRSMLERLLLGSVTSAVVRAGETSVLVVPAK